LEQISEHNDEAALWLQYSQGDEKAFTVLSQRYYRMLVHYGLKFTSDIQLVEDALQELLVRMWLRREHVGQPSSVKFYLLKAFRHQLFRSLSHPLPKISLKMEFEETPAGLSVEDEVIRNESYDLLKKRVNEVLATLTPRQQEVIYLRFFQDLSAEDISSLLSINPQSVSNIIQRAFAKIKKSASEASFTNNLFYPIVTSLFYFFHSGKLFG